MYSHAAAPAHQTRAIRTEALGPCLMMVHTQRASAGMSRGGWVPQGEGLSEEGTTDVETEDDAELPSRLRSQAQQDPESLNKHLSKYELLARKKRQVASSKKRRVASQRGVIAFISRPCAVHVACPALLDSGVFLEVILALSLCACSDLEGLETPIFK